MYKQTVVNLQQQENQAEDNTYYIYQLHKNIAKTNFYNEVVPDDPLAKEDFQGEDYKIYFEENFNEIGNNIINFVAFLSQKVEQLAEAYQEAQTDAEAYRNHADDLEGNHQSSADLDKLQLQKKIKQLQEGIKQYEMALEHSNNKLKKVKELLRKEQEGSTLREKIKELEETVVLKDGKLKELEKQQMDRSQLSSKTKDSKKPASNLKDSKVYKRG